MIATAEHRPYTVVSLFSGLGGLDLGFTWEGFQVIWANDISLDATRTYEINLALKPICADITKLTMDEIPTSDVIVGGPPCQSFSLMGKREVGDPRGNLVFHFYDVVKAKMPMAFVMENVTGMAASRINRQRLPEVLRDSFAKLGYRVSLMKLHAIQYLVPQSRTRLVLVGCKDRIPSEPSGSLFARECYGLDPDQYDLSAAAAIGDLGPCTTTGHRAHYLPVEPSVFARLMRTAGLPDVSLHECPRMSRTDQLLVQHIPPGGNYHDVPDAIAPGRILRYKETGGRTTTYGRLHPDRPAHTINTYFRRPNVGCNFHYSELRLITPREAMRFQSIPDHFELSYSSQDGRNALIGNAVPPLMARAIAWQLKKILNGDSSPEASANQEQPPLF